MQPSQVIKRPVFQHGVVLQPYFPVWKNSLKDIPKQVVELKRVVY